MSNAVETPPYRVGDWLPSDHETLVSFVQEQVEKAATSTAPLDPVLVELQTLIETDPEIYMLFNQMFDQVPRKPPYDKDPAGDPQIRSYQQMLSVMNEILTTTPIFNETGVVGFPINAILDYSMGTEGGFAAFLHPKVNAALKKVLNRFGQYLASPESVGAINRDADTGWIGDKAIAAMVGALPAVPGSGQMDNWDLVLTADQARDKWIKTFVCDPQEIEHYGFKSWDDFFTRTFRPGQRPVASPDDDRVVANACESAPYNLVRGAQRLDRFWIKGQPYSLQHMLDDHPLVDKFVEGTVYQAFLSAKAYHRWHSPVSGIVRDIRLVDGTYYSEIPAYGFYNPRVGGERPHHAPDLAGPNDSQGYISEVAARGMMFIENRVLGMVCFLAIGMAEVSSCQFTVKPGDKIHKGDPIGMFHFGGSSHCLIFGPQVQLDFDLHGQAPNLNAFNIPVCDRIAVARTAS